MTVIKTWCPTCGDIQLQPREVRLTDGPRPAYSFTCPPCGDRISRTATPDVTALLRSGGVLLEHIPAEVWELHVHPRISHDDLLDAHQALNQPDVDVQALLEREATT